MHKTSLRGPACEKSTLLIVKRLFLWHPSRKLFGIRLLQTLALVYNLLKWELKQNVCIKILRALRAPVWGLS